MCGRYSQTYKLKELMSRFLIDETGIHFNPRFNITPSQELPVVIYDQGKRSLELFRWGLIPSWAKEISIGQKLINARGESLMEKPSFKRLVERRRLLALGSSFFEWKKEEGRKGKTPYLFQLKSKKPFGFAGLWDHWKDPEGKEIRSFTIITTEANELVQNIHERMPVILQEKDEERWLDPENNFYELLPLLSPYPAGEMEAFPVSRVVNSPKNDLPECLQPV